MGKDVIFDYSKAAAFIHEEEIAGIKAGVQAARETLVEKTGAGNDFLGWIDLPVDYDKEEFMKKYEAYPYVQARYTLMEYVLKGAGFDLERIRADIK